MKVNKNIRMRLNIGRPDSAKACTDVSPKIPVLVRKVEYNIKTNVRIAKR